MDANYFPESPKEITQQQAAEMLTDIYAGKLEVDPRVLVLLRKAA
jgi:hypothetical protein